MAAEQEGEMNYPELTTPLRVPTRRKTKFSWTEVHQKHFELIKERLCSDRVIVPFDPERDTICNWSGLDMPEDNTQKKHSDQRKINDPLTSSGETSPQDEFHLNWSANYFFFSERTVLPHLHEGFSPSDK